MYVLGVGGFMHDYNCALIDLKNQKISVCEAERLSRRKHHTILDEEDLRLPIEKCCKELGCKIKNIEQVVFAHTDHFPVKDRFKALFKKCDFFEIDHHLCHAAGAYYCSSYDEASILSIDGFGDGSSGLLAKGNGCELTQIQRISEADSIGLEYLRATIHLGLGGYGSEGKTQGLAPYGEPTLFESYMNEIEILSTGELRLSKLLQGEGQRLATEGNYLNSKLLYNAFLNSYGQRRIEPEPLTTAHKDLAASIQKVLEFVTLKLATTAKAEAGSSNLVLSGGVSLNSSANGHLLRSREFDNIFALPQASDRGLGLGAALYHIHSTLKVPRFYTMSHAFMGSHYRGKDAKRAMKKAGLKIDKVSRVSEYAAECIANGEIIGWFQGGSEVGARALGHRSILADPRKADMKDIINERVKHREWFRPFAPAVLEDKAQNFFEIPSKGADLSFMTFTVQTTEEGQSASPATTHVDGSSRIQTVKSEHNSEYARVIEAFEEITGIPIILNTSFNDNGEPIVESPADAVKTFLNADIDVLCIGNLVGRKI